MEIVLHSTVRKFIGNKLKMKISEGSAQLRERENSVEWDLECTLSLNNSPEQTNTGMKDSM